MRLFHPIKLIRSYQLVSLIKDSSFTKALEMLDSHGESLNLNLKDLFQKTAIYYAIKNQSTDLALRLLTSGSLPHFTYKSNNNKNLKETVFHIAAGKSSLKIVEYLTNTFPDLILEKDSLGETPFDRALKNKFYGAIELFLNYFDNPQNIEKLKLYPSTIENLVNYFISEHDCVKAKPVLSFLEKYSLQTVDSNSNSLLMNFCPYYHKQRAEPRIFYELDYPQKEIERLMALSRKETDQNLANYLLKFHLAQNSPLTNVNQQNSQGQTALMILAEEEMYVLAELLLEKPDINLLLLNRTGQSILDIALAPSSTNLEGSSPANNHLADIKARFIEKAKIMHEQQKLSFSVPVMLPSTPAPFPRQASKNKL